MENKATANNIYSDFNFGELLNGIVKINEHIVQNYLKNHVSYQHDLRDIEITYASFLTKLFAQPKELLKVQNYQLEFLGKQQTLFKNIFIETNFNVKKTEPVISPSKQDKRFEAGEWDNNPLFNFIKQQHLLLEKLALKIVDEAELSETTRKRLDFYTKQYLETLSPSNFILTNPEALNLAIETQGKSLWNGFQNFVSDIEKGRISQVDEGAFAVGKNLAITPGAVVYQNELIQLIQYSPATAKTFEKPLLITPPWINKYYILDLQPKNSFVKFMVDQGFTVFIISWKNPSGAMGNLSFDDYVNKGALSAINITQKISGSAKINVLGYCLGGTLLGIAASILETRKNPIINTITFLGAMLDFDYIGPMGDVINDSLVGKLERGELLEDGVLHGNDMEKAFNLIRSKDMIWNYTVNNYLKGVPPPAFDVMYWTNDNTNLPARMYVYYMKEMIFKNKLVQINALNICDTAINISKISAPVYVIGMERDYISPPETVFITTRLLSGPMEFILGESGHVMGIANPPSVNKYGHYLNGELGKGFEHWKKTAEFHQGSWWTVWSDQLKSNSGKQIPASKLLGNDEYKEIEPAPGSYVKGKCAVCFQTTNP